MTRAVRAPRDLGARRPRWRLPASGAECGMRMAEFMGRPSIRATMTRASSVSSSRCNAHRVVEPCRARATSIRARARRAPLPRCRRTRTAAPSPVSSDNARADLRRVDRGRHRAPRIPKCARGFARHGSGARSTGRVGSGRGFSGWASPLAAARRNDSLGWPNFGRARHPGCEPPSPRFHVCGDARRRGFRFRRSPRDGKGGGSVGVSLGGSAGPAPAPGARPATSASIEPFGSGRVRRRPAGSAAAGASAQSTPNRKPAVSPYAAAPRQRARRLHGARLSPPPCKPTRKRSRRTAADPSGYYFLGEAQIAGGEHGRSRRQLRHRPSQCRKAGRLTRQAPFRHRRLRERQGKWQEAKKGWEEYAQFLSTHPAAKATPPPRPSA